MPAGQEVGPGSVDTAAYLRQQRAPALILLLQQRYRELESLQCAPASYNEGI